MSLFDYFYIKMLHLKNKILFKWSNYANVSFQATIYIIET